MPLQREIWQDHIAGNLFKNNEFMLHSINASHYVVNGKIVHIPQAGATATVVRDRFDVPGGIPATVVERTDSEEVYTLHEFTTDPIYIPDIESYELSYDKRESVLAEYEASLRQAVANSLLINWAPASGTNIVRTTGASAASHLAGTTGNRKRFTGADLKQAKLLMDRADVPFEDRYALLSADMFQQLTDSLEATMYRDFSAAYDAKNGILGRLYGFNIMMRSTVLAYTNDTTPVALEYGEDNDADTNDAVLCWQTNSMERALGDIKIFERVGDPTYYGDIYSVSVRMGGRIRNSTEKGVIAIVQDDV